MWLDCQLFKITSKINFPSNPQFFNTKSDILIFFSISTIQLTVSQLVTCGNEYP